MNTNLLTACAANLGTIFAAGIAVLVLASALIIRSARRGF